MCKSIYSRMKTHKLNFWSMNPGYIVGQHMMTIKLRILITCWLSVKISFKLNMMCNMSSAIAKNNWRQKNRISLQTIFKMNLRIAVLSKAWKTAKIIILILSIQGRWPSDSQDWRQISIQYLQAFQGVFRYQQGWCKRTNSNLRCS